MRNYKLSIDNSDFDVLIKEVTTEEVIAEVNGLQVKVLIRDIEVLEKPTAKAEKDVENKERKSDHTVPLKSKAQSTTAKAPAGAITAPIPGQIISINVSVGDKVLAGQKLLVLEAMKLENVITSTCDGEVQQLMIKEGEIIEQGQELIIIN